MIKAVSFVLLGGGVFLLILGVNAYDSSSPDISRFITGSATNKTILMLIGGVVGTTIGLVGLLHEWKRG